MNRLWLAALLFAAPALSLADGGGADTPLTRDEVTSVKRKLQAIATAIGVPAGYEKAKEDFQLPTEYSQAGDKKGYYPISGSVRLRFDGGQTRIGQQQQAMGQDMQAKMSEAMAKGDYEAIAKMQQDMVDQINAQQGQAMQATAKGEVDVTVSLNGGGSGGVDPDNIVLEKPGVLALKDPSSSGQRGRVKVYFDPVKLAKTGTISRLDLRHDTHPKKTAVLNVAVEIQGPPAAIEAMTKKIATDQVLAQIDK